MTHRFSVVVLLALASPALADTTPQPLPFSQDWSDTDLITTNNNWDNVPGIVGYGGVDLTSATGVDPQTILAPSTDENVLANRNNPNITNGGVAEFEIANPTIALQGSNSVQAPHIVITLDTTGAFGVRVTANIRDVDSSGDDAVQQLALQYRIGTSGDFTNIPAGYIPDATEKDSADKVTALSVLLPSAVDDQPVVQLRFITTNAAGSDEWVGIDDIQVFDDPTPPTAVGMATPATAERGASVTLTAAVTLGTIPTSTGIGVVCDLSSIGGSATQALFDDGTNGDSTADDNEWAFATTVGTMNVDAGAKLLPCTVSDAEARSSLFNIAFTVAAECGDGIVEGGEGCDDDNTTDGDGCSATCNVETGYECTGMPSTCADIDECTAGTDNCDDNATCTNEVGSFTCECNPGWDGDGTTCTDIDECADETDNCDAMATCTNLPGTFACECPSGYDGDGTTDGTGCTDQDECGAMADTCDENASCTNTNGGFTCACNDGYTGDGMTCEDIDECATGADNCSANATCTNTAGSFTCTCQAGFTGDGVTCTAVGGGGGDDDDGGCCSSSSHPGGAALLALVVIAGLRRRQRR